MATPQEEIHNKAHLNNEIDISKQSDFNYFVSESNLYVLNLEHDEILCQRAEKVTKKNEFYNYKDHMKVLRNFIFGSPEKRKDAKSSTFADIIHHFRTTQTKKKLFCRIDCYYLVKKFFTEGVQYVKQGEEHIYKTIERPLDIYISKRPLEQRTFRASYEKSKMKHERISPGETKIIPSDTYYIVIAPCHTFFKKQKTTTLGDENSTKTLPSYLTEEDNQITNVAEDGNELPLNEHTNQIEEMNRMPEPSGSRTDEHGNSRNSIELERFNEPAFTYGNASKGTRRSSTESDRQSKRMKSSTPIQTAKTSQMELALAPQSPNSLRNEMEQISENRSVNGSSIDHCHRAVFAVRRDNNLESYALRHGSTFQVLQDSIMNGSFTIENDDMDPFVIEYHGEVQYIRELAKFKNGSTFETTLPVQKDLLDELRKERRKERAVVNYFFEFAFKTIEAAYKRFSEMRNTKMIGSCVPAIVPLSDAKFCGVVPDIYETKP